MVLFFILICYFFLAELRNQIAKSEKSKSNLEQQVREQTSAQQVLREKEAEERRQLACKNNAVGFPI